MPSRTREAKAKAEALALRVLLERGDSAQKNLEQNHHAQYKQCAHHPPGSLVLHRKSGDAAFDVRLQTLHFRKYIVLKRSQVT